MATRRMDAREIAREYIARGWSPIPVPPKTKAPRLKNWQALRLMADDVYQSFRVNNNIGILLGEPSGWLVDVDLDHPLAVELADSFLPPTGAEFGRASKLRSHRLFVGDGATTRKLQTADGGMIVEMRSTGAQTVFPGSVHPSGEPIEWHSDGEPATIAPEALLAACEALANEVNRRLGNEQQPAARNGDAPHHANGVAMAFDRAKKYLDKLPGAITGQGGHNATMQAACECFRFGLTDQQAHQLLEQYNARCEPPWSDKELAHKLTDARKIVEAAGEFGCRLADRNGHATRHNAGPAISGEPATPDLRSAAGRTEIANARRLVARHGHDLRWCDPWSAWLVWDGRRWKADDSCRAAALAKDTADALWHEASGIMRDAERGDAAELLRFAKAAASERGISNMLSLARSEPGIAILPGALDADPWALNVNNGTIDLRTGDLHPHDRKNMLTKLAPVAFDARADCPLWCRVLDQWMNHDRELVLFLRRLAGYWLTGSVRDHVLPIFYGTGANGKSVFLNTIKAMMGNDYAMAAAHDLLLVKRNDSHPTERADLFGRRLVCCIEADGGRRLAEALVKSLTGGDTIRARRMHENLWEFVPTHKLVIAANHRPVVRGTDNGIWRRLRLVPWAVTIPADQQDGDLPNKLIAEQSGILNWALLGCIDWQQRGLGEPAAVEAATNDYRTENDTLTQYIAERCIIAPNASVQGGALYNDYMAWCEATGEAHETNTAFGKRLTEMGYPSLPGRRGKVRHGIGLLTANSVECDQL